MRQAESESWRVENGHWSEEKELSLLSNNQYSTAHNAMIHSQGYHTQLRTMKYFSIVDILPYFVYFAFKKMEG